MSAWSGPRRLWTFLLKLLGVFLILEPLWMLLPFAGFLYGSVLNIETLSRYPRTAWLTHFVFPVMTLGVFGLALSLIGLLVFFVGAGQIYVAKLRKSGLVSTGLYRVVRHPQYIALTLFSVGILLTWGRAIAYVAMFGMMLLYYYLTKLEERRCIELFGEDYERYRERTSFIIPGDRHLSGIAARLPWRGWPAGVRIAGATLLTAILCASSMWAIKAVKESHRVVPVLTTEIRLADIPMRPGIQLRSGRATGMAFVTDGRVAAIRGPYRTAVSLGFAERVVLRLRDSVRLAPFLAFLGEQGEDVVVAFGLPYDRKAGNPGARERGERGPTPDPFGPDRATLFLFRLTPAPGATLAEAIADPEKRTIRGACHAQVDLGRPAGEEIVTGELFIPGPKFPGEDRFAFVAAEVREQKGRTPIALAIPGTHASTTLVLVKAPIYRTRRDPAFAEEILDRLRASGRLAAHLRSMGAGGDIVPIIFPRPGEDWYRQHHGTPKITLFVILADPICVRTPVDELFIPDRRTLIGAFTATMDFRIARTEDSVSDFASIGLRRDLDERFAFFLSGL
jgi:protein-S-isoprenylcysteine O-methyltransferase Ste14